MKKKISSRLLKISSIKSNEKYYIIYLDFGLGFYMHEKVKFIRYPGGKQRLLKYILPHLPSSRKIDGKYVEPFVGGGSVFFAINPNNALLTDINNDLIELYKGIKKDPHQVWKIYKNFPGTKKGYYNVRDSDLTDEDIYYRSARILYLNRTCFKGMWRHNSDGDFNVGYGGQDRRWVINEQNLLEVSKRLKKASIKRSDFSKILNDLQKGDFVFIDPPYKPGKREMDNAHYSFGDFCYNDQLRLAKELKKATEKGIKWAMTNSSHRDIISLYCGKKIISLSKGTGDSPGHLTNDSKEVLILNYMEEYT